MFNMAIDGMDIMTKINEMNPFPAKSTLKLILTPFEN
jgi:hypothetical protein